MAKLVPVSQQFVQCSLPLRPDWKGMSDCCREPAVGAVRDSNGSYWYRCTTHRYLLTVFGGPDKNQTIRGPFVTATPVSPG